MVSIVVISLIVVFVLIVSGLIAYAITSKSKSAHVAPPGSNQTVCNVMPFSELVKCDPNDPNACNGCEGEYSCFAITDKNPYKITDDPSVDCNKTPDKCGNIPNGNWCLPVQVESDNCNPFSSTAIMTQITPQLWKWRCYCKYPEFINKVNIDADCTDVLACSPRLSPYNKLICPPDEHTGCTGGTEWYDDPSWDPTLGVCRCDTSKGLKPYKQYNTVTDQWELQCVVDSCSPGTVDPNDDSVCVCPEKVGSVGNWTSYVRCPVDFQPEKQGLCPNLYPSNAPNPMCMKDPCNPYGYFDPDTKLCVCDAPGSQEGPSSDSFVGSVCYTKCAENIPCGGTDSSTNRGTCFISATGSVQCKDCLANSGWTQDDTGMCAKKCLTYGTNCGEVGVDESCCPVWQCKWQHRSGNLYCHSD